MELSGFGETMGEAVVWGLWVLLVGIVFTWGVIALAEYLRNR